MFEFDLIQCGLTVLFLMTMGEVVSHRLKAVLPAILASALLFITLVWSGILPPSVIEDSGFLHLTAIAMMCTIIGMGLSTNPKELIDNWRVVALAAVSYIGQTMILMLVIGLIFNRNTAIGSLPGGAAVALIVQEHAGKLGLEQIVVQSVLLVSVQGLVACPIISWMLRKEISQMKKHGILTARSVRLPHSKQTSSGTVKHSRLKIRSLHPAKAGAQAASSDRFGTSVFASLLRLYLVAWLASRLELLTGISRYVFCLLLGVVLGSAGLLPKDELDRSKSRGLFTLMMMVTVLNGFAGSTPQMFLDLLGPLVCILLTDVLSIWLITFVFGKLLSISRPMRFAIGLNVMVGFPLNLMLAQDLIEYLVTDPEERRVLNEQIASKMVIAGFTSVTFLSTIGAGLLVKLLHP